MPSSHYTWLLNQLTEGEREGLITAEAAVILRRRAEASGESRSGQLGLIIFGVIGAALIATGIIAVLAYNWDWFPRWVRLVVAFLPMACGQAGAAWALRRGDAMSGWVRESIAVFLGISVGTCLAVVSQVYNLGGEWQDFMLAWSLLAVPLVWLLRSSAGACLYMLAITVWACGGPWWGSSTRWMETMWYPLLLLPLLPWWPGREWRKPAWPPLGFSWVAAPCLMIASLAITERLPDLPHLAMMQMVLALAAVFVLLPGQDAGFGRRPFMVTGSLVLFGCGLVLSSDDYGRNSEVADHVLKLPLFWLYAVVGLALLVGVVRARRGAGLSIAAIGGRPLLKGALPDGGAWLLVNALLFVTGIFMIMPAFRGETGSPRLGAALLSMVVITRFLDSDLPLLGKGVGFILVGIGFLVFNIALARRTKVRTTP